MGVTRDYKYYAAQIVLNAGHSRRVVRLLDDDNPLYGCRFPTRLGEGKWMSWEFCNKVTLYEGIGGWAGIPFCKPHAKRCFGVCDADECEYEGNFIHGDTPWDYDSNAPDGDDYKAYCYFHSLEPRGDDGD